MTTTNNRLRFFYVFFFSFCFLAVTAQSKKVGAELEEADYSYYGKKFDEARAIYLKHTQYLSPQQQLYLGVSFFSLAQKDPSAMTTGIDWIRKSANAGFTEAMNTLSYLYGAGVGVSKDPIQELHWLTQSADGGDNMALYTLGNRYELGKGVTKDEAKAKSLYIKAADKGSKEAAYQLGSMALNDRNVASALAYLKQAAKRNSVPAMLKLGEIYENGTGLGRKDPDEAVRWYTKISKVNEYTTYHRTASDRIRAIGTTEPPTDLATVKPQLLQLVTKAGSEFGGLLSQTVEPLDKAAWMDILSENTYYSCTIDLGFKNAVIHKEVVKNKDLGNGFRTKPGTSYTYTADIVHSSSEADAKRVFAKWINIFKEVIPQWKGSKGNDPDSNVPEFTMSGKLTSGKTVNISLSVCCPANSSKKVVLSISSE